jgi:hypothetical protein
MMVCQNELQTYDDEKLTLMTDDIDTPKVSIDKTAAFGPVE